jgi:hypothetical protein
MLQLDVIMSLAFVLPCVLWNHVPIELEETRECLHPEDSEDEEHHSEENCEVEEDDEIAR